MKFDDKWTMARNTVAQRNGYKDWAHWDSLRTLPFSEHTYYEVAQVYITLLK